MHDSQYSEICKYQGGWNHKSIYYNPDDALNLKYDNSQLIYHDY